ncbi:MAG: hypothetical protein M3176_12455 [Chloroflexota bacterium]|nr:hypothetical protein [Chloroflexota bacterium]MDQ6907631.1 hypothetical protein [Chloroflexota bacterium]
MSAKSPRQSASSRRAATAHAKRQAARTAMRRYVAMIGIPVVLVLIGAAVFVSRVVPRTHTATATAANVAAAPGAPFVAGSPIDGVQCGATEGQTQHVHQHFDVVINGQDFTPPQYVGIFADKTSSPNTPCLYWSHTHTADGVIHVESPAKDTVVLGAFLDIWSVSPVDRTLLNRIQANPPDRVIVDGKPYTGDYRAIPLLSHSLITLEYGSPDVPQRPFDFQTAGLPT